MAGGIVLPAVRLIGRPRGMVRRQDWPERLAELIEERRGTPFQWGVFDCAMFVADAVLVQTGRDPLAAWRGRYCTEEGGHLLTAPSGGFVRFMEATFRDFGAPDCPPDLTQRGDVAICRYGNTESLALVTGDALAVPGMEGLSFLPMRNAVRAWAI